MSKIIESQTWYVVFCNSEQLTAPWKWFTSPGFEHCLCFAESPVGSIVLNYTDFHCDVRLAGNQSAQELAFGFVNGGASVLQVTTNKKLGWVFRGFVYCVPITKTFLGLRGCWSITPKGLHKWLKKSSLDVIDLNEITEKVMGGAPKSTVDPELQKRQAAELERSEREAERLRQERIAGVDRSRRNQSGLFSLLKTEGGELGSPKTLLGSSK